MYLETDNKLVGHVPMELFFLIFTFLKARCENKEKVKETGKQTLLSLDPSPPERPAEQSPQPGAGGERRSLGLRNNVLTTCKAVPLREGQRIIALFPTVNIFRLFRSKKRTGRGNQKCLKN